MANSSANLNGTAPGASIKQLVAEEQAIATTGAQQSGGPALVLTPDQRVEETVVERATRGPLVGLHHLFDALSGRIAKREPAEVDAAQDTVAVENLHQVWSGARQEEYYEDESAVGLPSERQEQKLDSATAQSMQETQADQLDPDGVVASFMAEQDLDETPKAADTPETPEATNEVQFRHRGWSYDLMSAAGWQKGPNAPEGPFLDYREVEKQLAEQETEKNGGTPRETPSDDQITRLNPVRNNRARRQAPQSDEVTIDRDMLREIVAEVLREELSGEMGERVTRNVRKLVRREIARALQIDGDD